MMIKIVCFNLNIYYMYHVLIHPHSAFSLNNGRYSKENGRVMPKMAISNVYMVISIVNINLNSQYNMFIYIV